MEVRVGYYERNLVYGECLKNHAARLGNYATDGCGEFLPKPPPENETLLCAACGCHRNFHRKVFFYGEDIPTFPSPLYGRGSPGTDSTEKKRFRTRFSAEQKARMLVFAEKIGWSMHKGREEEIMLFCNEINVTKQVFKVWMHNHKLTSPIVAESSLTG